MPNRTFCPAIRSRLFVVAATTGPFAMALLGCGSPVVATPMPEPPSIDLSRLLPGDPSPVTTMADPHSEEIRGGAGAAPPQAVVYVTNLDAQSPPTATTARADGSFSLVLLVGSHDELRFQVVLNGARGTPVDCGLGRSEQVCTPAVRPRCVAIEPGLEVRGDVLPSAALRVRNECAETVTLSEPRARLVPPEFTLDMPSPITLLPTDSGLLTIVPSADAVGNREEVVFFTATAGTTAVRYPITIY